MLRHIYIKDFAIISHLDLALHDEMTVITGETGAGKSIIIDALDMALGERADSRWVRHGAQRCDISLTFDVSCVPEAKQWLAEHALLEDDDCIIRRSISAEGRSKHFINGQPVALQELKQLGAHLVHIHGQHAHQHLVKHEHQRKLLDRFAGHNDLLTQTQAAYDKLHEIEQAITKIEQAQGKTGAERELLAYQLEELTALDLKLGEFGELSLAQQQLTHAGELLHTIAVAQQALDEADDSASVKALLEKIIHQLSFGQALSPTIANAITLLDTALVEINEASRELAQAMSHIQVDPERLQQVEMRLSQAFQLARKHKTTPEALPELTEQIAAQLTQQAEHEQALQALQAQLPAAKIHYHQQAQALHQSRLHHAARLSECITQSLHELHMQDATLSIQVQADGEAPGRLGTCRIAFLASTNKGQPMQPLAKIASGGELSRVSLAIQVITATQDATPTLVFDEVDVGIGGATAAVVGQLLRRLGQQAQVLCITHLPQVAAYGHHHIRIAKYTDAELTHSNLETLSAPQRIDELARMLGGAQITAQTRAHAEEMLSTSAAD